MEPQAPLYEAYRAHFGEGVILPDGQLNRRRIGQIALPTLPRSAGSTRRRIP